MAGTNLSRGTPQQSPGWVRAAALVLIALSVFGSFLPGVEISIGVLFAYRLALPIFIVLYGISLCYSGKPHLQMPPSLASFAAFVAVLTISSVVAMFSDGGIRGPLFLATQLALLLAVILTLTNRRWIYRGWLLLTAITLVAFGFAAVELVAGWHVAYSQINSLPDRAPYNTWFTGWFTNVNDLAFLIHFGTMLPLVLAFRRSMRRSIRAICALIWAVGVAIAVHLGARALIVAFALSFVIAGGLMRMPTLRRALGRVPTRVSMIALPALGIVGSGFLALAPNPVTRSGSSLWVRWQLQTASVLVGGAFGRGYGRTHQAIAQSPINTMTTGGTEITSPHSWFGAIVGGAGILGLILFLAFYGGALVRLLRTSADGDPVWIVSTTAFISLPIAGLGPSNVLQMSLFWVVLGLCIATQNAVAK